MTDSSSLSRGSRVLAFSARHPWATIVITAGVVAAALFCIKRFHASGSLESLMDEDDPAAVTMARVAEQFQAADTLILLVSAEDANEAAHDRLIEFAAQFTLAVENDPALQAIVGHVQYRVDPDSDERRFVENEIVPSALLYLTDEQFQAAVERLSAVSMREQIQRNEELISSPGPAADALARTLLRDPLRLREFLAANIAKRFGALQKLSTNEDAFFSRDRRSLMIRIEGRRPVSDIEYAKSLLLNMQRVANTIPADGLTLEYTGAYAIAAASEHAIRRDMIRSVFGSVVLMQLLFLLVYRRLVSFPLAIIPTAVGIVVAFAIMSFITTDLTPITAVIGAVLAGLGIDYCIHLLSEFHRARAGGATKTDAAVTATRTLFAPIAMAVASSMLGFIAIAQSSVRALREFAWLGALGLFASMIAAFILLPALLVIIGKEESRTSFRARTGDDRLKLQYIIQWIERKPALSIVASISLVLAAAVVIAPGRGESILPIESDLSVMHPRPNPALDLQLSIAERFGGASDSMMIYLSCDSADELVRDAHAVAQSLDSARMQGGPILGSYGLANYLPDPQSIDARRAAIQSVNVERVIDDFRAAIDDSIFDVAAYEPFIEFLRRFLRPGDGPDVDTLRHYPRLAATFMPRSFTNDESPPNESLILALLDRPLNDQTSRDAAVSSVRAAVASVPGATLTGLTVIGHDTQRAIRQELARQMIFAAVAVVALILLVFRNVIDTCVTLLPTVFGSIVTLASMRLLGEGLNMVNLIGLALLAGIGVDNGIFITSMARRARLNAKSIDAMRNQFAAGLQAIVMTSATTGLAFGSLVFTSVPAIQSLGRLTAVGITATLLCTVFLLIPIHITLHRCSNPSRALS